MKIEEIKKENARLKREIEIEKHVTLRWKALAGVFHDTLWSALRRYDPPVYEKLRREKKSGQPYCPAENQSDQSTFSQTDAGLAQAGNKMSGAVPSGSKKEQPKEGKEEQQAGNSELELVLTRQIEEHKKWERMAVCFHDTLWQVLLKYEPDTYGPLYPEHKTDTEPEYSCLLDPSAPAQGIGGEPE